MDKSIIINNCGITDSKGKLKFYSYKYHRVNSFIKIDENSNSNEELYSQIMDLRNRIEKIESYLNFNHDRNNY